MSLIQFTPDKKAQVHEEGAIRLLCRSFSSHEAGLPEWVKNPSDNYRRLKSDREDSIIILLFRNGTKTQESLVGCLDLGGMSSQDIEGKFCIWADPEAAGKGSAYGIQGGHGNGGKCYMTQMFESYAYLHTLKNNLANKYGFQAGKVVPGYFPSPEKARNYIVKSPDDELNEALKPFGLTVSDLPDDVQRVWNKSKGFTLVLGAGAKGYRNKKLPVGSWLESIKGHQQMVHVINWNAIYTYYGKSFLEDANPMSLPEIRPIPGSEAGRSIQIPKKLKDPNTRDKIETGATENSVLELRTSDVKMYRSLKSRHTINGWTTTRQSTGFWEVSSLSSSGYSWQIYGDIYLDNLENYKQNDRRNHSEAPLTRALKKWITDQIEDYCAVFVAEDRLQASEEEKSELSKMNEALNQWKDRFLDHQFGGIGNLGRGGGGDVVARTVLPRGKVKSVILRFTHTSAGRGMSFRPFVEFFNNDGRRIRPSEYEWEVSDLNIAYVDKKLNTITTFAAGQVDIRIKCTGSSIASNTVTLDVLDIVDIELAPLDLTIRCGSRSPLTAVVNTRDGQKVEGCYLEWTESNNQIISVGSSGMVYGLKEGSAAVVAGDDQAMSSRPATITITEGMSDEDGGSGYPKVLLSEIDDDPFGDAPPTFTEAEAPVHQCPQDYDRNIWWINMASPLARRYIDSAKGDGPRSREWRVYLLERYIEVMIKILLTYDYEGGGELTFETMLGRWEEEAVQMHIHAAKDLDGFLDEGTLPNVG